MQVFIEVLKDLWRFVFPYENQVSMPATKPQPLLISPTPTAVALPTQPVILDAPHDISPVASGGADGLLVSVREAGIYKEPTVSFDGRIGVATYGQRVVVEKQQGRFALVYVGYRQGWMFRDDIGSADMVLPVLSRGHRYDAADSVTKRLRACIGDTFTGEVSDTVLQPGEYVTYALWYRGFALPWTETWGRVPGTWQRKLRGVPGVHMDVQPHTGAIMEYILDEVGYLAYVERVSPTGTLTLSGVGLTYEAQYTEQVLTHDVWRELRPVFITLV